MLVEALFFGKASHLCRSRRLNVEVVELPYQATPEQRLEMLRGICRKLERVEQDENDRWVG